MMPNEGVLIFDNNPEHTLLDKVLGAARCHAEKFGIAANVVYVHPSVLETALTAVVGGIPVVARKWALHNHYYAVREDE